jgi:hypothetical protein
VTATAQLLNWRQLALLSDGELGRYDIASVNLACAEGLPGASEIDVGECLSRLDAWAKAVLNYTVRLLPHFREKPHEYENSEAYFRTLALVTVLQRDLGVRYNPAKIPADAQYDTADSFIHGVIQGDGRTCATLPVVYAAVGRRLGYPIKLAAARGKNSGHLFARWDDAAKGERFNIEASGQGLTTPSDDHFRAAAYELPPEVEVDGCLLRSETPRMDLAGFLANRAWRWEDLKDWWRCVDSWAWASSLVPENKLIQNSLRRCLIEWDREQERVKPAGFPEILVRSVCRQFPTTLPLELEQAICGLTAANHILTDPRIEERHWKRMRRGDFDGVPTRATADFAATGQCRIDLLFN